MSRGNKENWTPKSIHRGPSQQRYVSDKRWVKNKLRRMARHVKHFPGDLQAWNLMQNLGWRSPISPI